MQQTDENQDLASKFSTSESHASKKRKMVERVVSVRVEENGKKQQRNEGPPSDCWSWRKYGQKPIKGSPHPRGYYKCSTSKGCSAKKQVERCKTDASMLIITYTSTHNHPPTKQKQDCEDPVNVVNQEMEASVKEDGDSSSVLKAEENDLFGELEELPTCAFLTAFCEDRSVAVNLS